MAAFFTARGRSGLDPLEVVLVAIRIAGVSLAARQQIALAAEAANALHDARIVAEDLRLGQLQFSFCRAVLQEVFQFFIGSFLRVAEVCLGFLGILIWLGGNSEIKLAGDLVESSVAVALVAVWSL